jgi:L-2-hydroxyglutarate oxidase LhgO
MLVVVLFLTQRQSWSAMYTVDTLVVGAGVMGLAIAHRCAIGGEKVALVDREDSFGRGLSSRNSEVIHAGLYYSPGSLKARACVRGRELLYDFLSTRKIPHRKLGKLIVATDDAQIPALESLSCRAEENGVADAQLLDATAAHGLEPRLRCVGALHSPSTGIFDSHAFMRALEQEAQDSGAMIAYRTRFERAEVRRGHFHVFLEGRERTEIRTRRLINAAGMAAHRVASAIVGLDSSHIPSVYYAKGSYFAIRGRIPFTRLIYPMPEPGGLGIHLGWDLAGQGRAGPDVQWSEPGDLGVDPKRAPIFEASIRRYWPTMPQEALSPGFASWRPKLVPQGEPPGDFLVQGWDQHGVEGLINFFGIESPGLTAALALAEGCSETV